MPQVPPWQPLMLQVPWVPGQALPEATQVRLLLSQQPPLAQVLPSQQGWPGPPQVAHFPPLQARPAAVQKRAPVVAFWQQFWPDPPQLFPPFVQEPLVHAPRVPPQVAAGAKQVVLPPQQEPIVEQPLPAQHGMLVPPQATAAPLAQTDPVMLGMF